MNRGITSWGQGPASPNDPRLRFSARATINFSPADARQQPTTTALQSNSTPSASTPATAPASTAKTTAPTTATTTTTTTTTTNSDTLQNQDRSPSKSNPCTSIGNGQKEATAKANSTDSTSNISADNNTATSTKVHSNSCVFIKMKTRPKRNERTTLNGNKGSNSQPSNNQNNTPVRDSIIKTSSSSSQQPSDSLQNKTPPPDTRDSQPETGRGVASHTPTSWHAALGLQPTAEHLSRVSGIAAINHLNNKNGTNKVITNNCLTHLPPTKIKLTTTANASTNDSASRNTETTNVKNGLSAGSATNGGPSSTSNTQANASKRTKEVPTKNMDPKMTAASPNVPATLQPFTWDVYLKLIPAEIAPKEAFMQTSTSIINQFKPGMKLEARDPRNNGSWCLATVILTAGLRLRLRFDGGDSMNDFFELIDSNNIRSIGSRPGELLFAPLAYKGSISTYPKYVEKVLAKPETVLASPEFFLPQPKLPKSNLFQEGMKLEAVDRKNPYLICPATVGEVNGDDIEIRFDGWKGSFDYSCKYYSREIFPVNWCRDTGHLISAPNGWETLVAKVGTSEKLTLESPAKKLGQISAKVGRTSFATPKPSKSSPPFRPGSSRKIPLLSKDTDSPKREKKTSTPKRSLNKQQQQQHHDELSSEEFSETLASPCSPPDMNDTKNRYQCQRTVSYGDWLKLKRSQALLAEPSITKVEKPAKVFPETEPAQGVSNPESSFESDNTQTNSSSSLFTESVLKPPSEMASSSQGPEPKRARFASQLSDSQPLSTPGTPPRQNNRTSNYTLWTVNDVLDFLCSDPSLTKIKSVFENHEIDGKAFVLLTTDIMVNHMGLKIGPVLKINDMIERVKRGK